MLHWCLDHCLPHDDLLWASYLQCDRLTSETFNAGASLSAGSYSYDARGRKTAAGVTPGGTPYTFGFGFDDADHPTSLTYSDSEVLTSGYDLASGWLTSASATLNTVTTLLLHNIAYTGASGGRRGRAWAMARTITENRGQKAPA